MNLGGAFVLTQMALAQMIPAGKGRIVDITSYAGVYRWPLLSAYAASKAALVKLTETLAEETRPHSVCVFSVDPGLLPIGLGEAALISTAEAQTHRGAGSTAGFASSSPRDVAPIRKQLRASSSPWPAAKRTASLADISASPTTSTHCSPGSTASSAATCTRCGCERSAGQYLGRDSRCVLGWPQALSRGTSRIHSRATASIRSRLYSSGTASSAAHNAYRSA